MFFFNAPAPTEIYTLSLHDALPICRCRPPHGRRAGLRRGGLLFRPTGAPGDLVCLTLSDRIDLTDLTDSLDLTAEPARRSEEHTSELQSPCNLVCRLLLERKNSRCESHAQPGSRPSATTRRSD